jgi:hypothetical protein
VWTDGIAFEHLGVRVGIRADSADLIALATSRLPPGSTPIGAEQVDVLFSLTGGTPAPRRVRRFVILYDGIVQVVRTLDREAIADALDTAMHVALADRAEDWVFLHAGVVGWRDKAILVPGSSLSGKTSLVAAMVRAGAVYYSDDRALIDSAGQVHPYPKPLAIRTSPLARQVLVEPTALGAQVGTRPLPVGIVAFTKYEAGASWSPRVLPRGQAILATLHHTSALRVRPHATLQMVQRALAGAAALAGSRGEAIETAERLLALI